MQYKKKIVFINSLLTIMKINFLPYLSNVIIIDNDFDLFILKNIMLQLRIQTEPIYFGR